MAEKIRPLLPPLEREDHWSEIGAIFDEWVCCVSDGFPVNSNALTVGQENGDIVVAVRSKVTDASATEEDDALDHPARTFRR
ncbi:MAG: hypothetical protein M3N49_03960 [Candidatus Eremiobacteraeota bacterium]|nr:hypothetical protein [Candidatus Eremiobacteraeota bacterium]